MLWLPTGGDRLRHVLAHLQLERVGSLRVHGVGYLLDGSVRVLQEGTGPAPSWVTCLGKSDLGQVVLVGAGGNQPDGVLLEGVRARVDLCAQGIVDSLIIEIQERFNVGTIFTVFDVDVVVAIGENLRNVKAFDSTDFVGLLQTVEANIFHDATESFIVDTAISWIEGILWIVVVCLNRIYLILVFVFR